jgi:hypothetical protein
MYGMGGGGTNSVATAITATTTGAAGVAVLPDTGSFKVMFYIAAVAMAIGVVTLIATTVARHKKSADSKSQ